GSADARGGLTALRLGPPATLRLAYEARRLFQTGVPVALTFAVALSFFAAVPLWLKTRQRVVLLFTAMCLTWSPRALLVLSPAASGPTPMGLFAVLAGTLICNVFILLLVLELSGWHSRFWRGFVRFVWALTATVSACALVLALRGALRPVEAVLLHLPFYAAMMVPLAGLIERAWRAGGRSEVFMAVSFTVWLGAVMHDMAVAGGLMPLASFFVAPLPALLVLLSLIWRTLEKMALERDGAEREISQAVAHVSTEHGQRLIQLREEFDRHKAEERQAVIAAERTRLLHDLHDGMGSQLITALRMTRRDEVPREEVARVIEDSLEDMRLIIDSLDLEESDLLPLLANLRYRLEPRLNAIGVGLQWEVGPLPEMDYLTPETGLSILRTLQEAINNAVRHGAARTITVRAHATAGTVKLSITDDGCGFDTQATPAPGKTQRGLAAMRLRAQKFGGQVHISSGTQGTCVTLELPLQR
ncbi:sensor histidine kinase, partial [Polaromonas sp.]|uniref:sensor histidine kinase n=1 Tax=Polaromonas sp. TaxID=1869339 RepID=UPI003C8401E8